MSEPASDTGSTRAVAEPEPRVGWWRRLRDWLAAPPGPVDGPEHHGPLRPGSEPTLRTPAKGDAYDFLVDVHWRWTDGHWSTRWLKRSTGPGRATVWEEISIAVRCVLRAFPPHMPAEAEEALNLRLGEMAGRDGRWRARAEVGLDDAVRELQQESWNRVLKQDADRTLARNQRRADHELAQAVLEDHATLVQRWRRLLADVGIGEDDGGTPPPYVGRYLIRLAADPTAAADVVDRLSERREERDDQLMEAVIAAMKSRNDVNLMEADLAYDSALRRLMDWAGLPLPEPVEPPWPNGTAR